MSIRTIYKCDKCGNENETSVQFWTIGVVASCTTSPRDELVPGKYLQVCRPCLESFGIHVQKRPEHETNPPTIPSVEDLIREIIDRCSE